MTENAERVPSHVARFLKRFAGDELARRVLGPGLLALIIKSASAVTSYAMLVAFARLLDENDYGHFGLSFNLAVVVSTVIGVGLPTAVMRFWPEHLAKGQRQLAHGFVRGALWLMAGAASFAMAVGLLLGFEGYGAETLGPQYGFLAVAVIGGLFALSDFLSGALRAQGQTLWALVPRDIVWRTIAPVLAIAFAFFTGHLGINGALWTVIGTLVVVTTVQGAKFLQLTKQQVGDAVPASDWSYWRASLIPFAASSVLFAMAQQLDVVVVGFLAGPAEAGAYFAAQKTASLLGLAMIAGGLVSAPMISAAFHSGNTPEVQRICRMLAMAIAATTLAGYAMLWLIGGHLLAIFEPEYVSAYPILLILGLGFSIDALAGPSAYLMQMTSLERPYVRIMAIVYAFVLALQFYLVPRYGVVSAAIASAAGTCLWNVISIFMLRRAIGVDPSIFSLFFKVRQQRP